MLRIAVPKLSPGRFLTPFCKSAPPMTHLTFCALGLKFCSHGRQILWHCRLLLFVLLLLLLVAGWSERVHMQVGVSGSVEYNEGNAGSSPLLQIAEGKFSPAGEAKLQNAFPAFQLRGHLGHCGLENTENTAPAVLSTLRPLENTAPAILWPLGRSQGPARCPGGDRMGCSSPLSVPPGRSKGCFEPSLGATRALEGGA